ncbi:hypothetical protein CJU90_0540 [Yarrowia sp. C11]|nr:hypothetical protein CKK34_1952 [Yarrowia sp. E02]KAG5372884.1 hypothetical protein CJU90_0540 [Yarrowia sp. C11]
MAANKGKAQGGKKKKNGKNGKAAAPSSKAASNQTNEGDTTPDCIKRLQASTASFMALMDRKLKKWPDQRNQVASLAHICLVVITGSEEERVTEYVESLILIFNELSENDNPAWTPTGQTTIISTLSDKFTKWASAQGLLFQYTRALVEGSTNPIEDAPQIIDSATRDYGKLAQTILDYSKSTNGNNDSEGEKEAAGPSLDSMIEALSASGVEVSAKETQQQQSSSSQSTSAHPQPKDPKQVAQAFLMFKPYMSQMIEARRKAEQQLQVLQAEVTRLSQKVEEFEQTQEPQLLSKDAEAVYEPDPRLTLENNTKEFMREHFKAFLSQYKLREEYFEKLLKARSSETAVQIMKVKKYRELSRAGWRLASEALDSLSKVDEQIRMIELRFTNYKALSGATIESLVQEHESSKRDFKYLELEHEQTKNRTELMTVMMSDVVAYNAELKEALMDYKDLAEAWRLWAEASEPMIQTTLPDPQMQAMHRILAMTEGLVPREGDDPQPPTDGEIEEMLRKGRLEGKTVEQVSQEVISATENALKLARERREKRHNNLTVASRVSKHVEHVLASQTKPDDNEITEQMVKNVVEAAKVLDGLKPAEPSAEKITEVSQTDKPAQVSRESATPAPKTKEASSEVPKTSNKKQSPKPATDGYEADVDDAEVSKEPKATEAKATPPTAGLPEPPAPATNAAYSAALGPRTDSHLTVYSPVHSDDEDKSREAAHDEADGEDDDDFGYKRYVAHEGDVSSEEDEYFLRAKFGICYHDRYNRRGKATNKDVNSYMGVFGGTADKSHNLCAHDMGADYGQARFSDRRGHLFSEVLLHDYVQSDDDTSMQNWTDEVEWEEGVTPDEDEDDDEDDPTSDTEGGNLKRAAVEKANAVQNAIDIASGAKEGPIAGTAAANEVACVLQELLSAEKDEQYNAVQIPEHFTEEEWKTLQTGFPGRLVPLMLTYMIAAYADGKILSLDRKFPLFVTEPCNWTGAIATMNLLTSYYHSKEGYRKKYGWDPIPRTIKSFGDIGHIYDESRALCKVSLDLIPLALYAGRALVEVALYPTWASGDARDQALQEAIKEHEGFLSVEDLYRIVLEVRPPLWADLKTAKVFTTLLNALVCSFVSIYMRMSRFPFELDKLAALPVVPLAEGAGAEDIVETLTRIEGQKARFLDVSITRLEQVLLTQSSAALRRGITKNVYPVDTSDVVDRGVQGRVMAFLAGVGGDPAYNNAVEKNRAMLLRSLYENRLDVERVSQLQDSYEELDGQNASVAQTANDDGEGSANGSANGTGTNGGIN